MEYESLIYCKSLIYRKSLTYSKSLIRILENTQAAQHWCHFLSDWCSDRYWKKGTSIMWHTSLCIYKVICHWKVINLINFQYVLETQILRVFACRICIRKIIDAKKSKFCKIRIIGNVMRIVVTLLVAWSGGPLDKVELLEVQTSLEIQSTTHHPRWLWTFLFIGSRPCQCWMWFCFSEMFTLKQSTS